MWKLHLVMLFYSTKLAVNGMSSPEVCPEDFHFTVSDIVKECIDDTNEILIHIDNFMLPGDSHPSGKSGLSQTLGSLKTIKPLLICMARRLREVPFVADLEMQCPKCISGSKCDKLTLEERQTGLSVCALKKIFELCSKENDLKCCRDRGGQDQYIVEMIKRFVSSPIASVDYGAYGKQNQIFTPISP